MTSKKDGPQPLDLTILSGDFKIILRNGTGLSGKIVAAWTDALLVENKVGQSCIVFRDHIMVMIEDNIEAKEDASQSDSEQTGREDRK